MSRPRNHNETVDLFLAAHCRRDEHTNTTVAELTSAYNDWTAGVKAGSDEPPITARALTIALRARGVDTGRNRNARYYIGVGLAVTHTARPPRSLSNLRDMFIARSEDEAQRVDAKRRLVELIQMRRRLYVDARWDPELRSELDSVDVEMLACERELSR
jgi:hypothetical protein